MRARTSLLQLSLIGFANFLLLISALCIAFIIAITGPPTKSEIAGARELARRSIQTLGSASLSFSAKLCDHFPLAAHAAGLCQADRSSRDGELKPKSPSPPAAAARKRSSREERRS
jgi:hypothetical protein